MKIYHAFFDGVWLRIEADHRLEDTMAHVEKEWCLESECGKALQKW